MVYKFKVGEVNMKDQELKNQLTTYSDTDFAGCTETRRSTAGGCIFLAGHLVKHWSSRLKTIALSSVETELGGIVKAASESTGM